jgi:O-antigen ligase
MPDWVLAGQPEIAQQLSPDSLLYPNPKNLYARLLAETGLIGFVLFMTFYLALLAEVLSLLRVSDPLAHWLAAAGLFALVAIGLQGFSQDSFAAPEMWINLGILAGAAGYWAKGLPSKEQA